MEGGNVVYNKCNCIKKGGVNVDFLILILFVLGLNKLLCDKKKCDIDSYFDI